MEKIFKNIEASAQGTSSEDNFKGLFDEIDRIVKRENVLRKEINAIIAEIEGGRK